MAKRLLGKEVNEALVASLKARSAALGENPSDLSYEKGATKRAEEVGVAVKNYILPENATKEEVLAVIAEEQPLGGAPRAVARRVQARVRGWTTGEVYAILPRVK